MIVSKTSACDFFGALTSLVVVSLQLCGRILLILYVMMTISELYHLLVLIL
jgi:hypothetical protein